MKTNPHVVPLVGESPSFLRVIEKLPLLADCDTTVLISGETGSGKEVMARAIHYQGARRGSPFIPVNCGALPDHLFENELFGHVKGAFTDASSAENGLIVEAEGGTLFLDEIDALSQSGQVKLLRFLQNGEYRPVGSPRSVIAKVRVIAATNADLRQRVKSQLFREDLYYRLNSLSLLIPPLRQRVEDIMLLVTYFLNEYAMEHSQKVREISQAALGKLMKYSWPGNIRELESVITRTLVFTTSETLRETDIELPSPDCGESSRTQFMREAKTSTIRTFERGYLATLLATHHGNVSQAAKAAGKARRSFQRLLRKHNLDRESFRCWFARILQDFVSRSSLCGSKDAIHAAGLPQLIFSNFPDIFDYY
jgi:DNA-binding NtrC family response regulator